MKKRFVFIFLTLLAALNQTFAVTAYPFPQDIKQPDGSVITIQIKGDERYNWVTTDDHYRILKNSNGIYEYATLNSSGQIAPSGIKVSKKQNRTKGELDLLKNTPVNLGINSQDAKNSHRNKQLINPLKSSNSSTQIFPTIGSHKYILILASFSDTNPTYSSEDFNNLMNQNNYNGSGSFKDYFTEVSYGQLTLETTVTVWVTLDEPQSFYAPEEKWPIFAYEAIQKANETGIDFSQFDNDNNGIVDGIGIVHVGTGQEVSGNTLDIWSHSYSLSSGGYDAPSRYIDNVYIDAYTAMPELRNTANDINTIGVFCHEFAHNLGTYDFYDTLNNSYTGTGRWDLMALGTYLGTIPGNTPAHPTAWVKEQFGWITVTTISSPKTIELLPIETTPTAYRINCATSNEYFLLENRQNSGFDTYLPGHGLIIYHVDENYINEHIASNSINASAHQGLYPIIAGGTLTNSASTPFPGYSNNTAFTDDTDPAALDWSNSITEKSITNITETNQLISFDFMEVQSGSPTNFMASTFDDQQIDLSWQPAVTNGTVLIAYSETELMGSPTDNVSYSIDELLPDGGKVIYIGTNTTYSHTNLTPNTKYYYNAWSLNNGSYSQPVNKTASTYALNISSFPWIEDFESGISNWSEDYIFGPQINWTTTNGSTSQNPSTAYLNAANLSLYSTIPTTSSSRIKSPILELLSTKSYRLEFFMTQANWGGNQDSTIIRYRLNTEDTWNELRRYTKNTPTWTKDIIDLPSGISNIQLCIDGYTNNGYGICIDNLQVYEYTPCSPPSIPPTNFVINSITQTTINFSWTNNDGDNVIAIMREGNPVNSRPQDGISYTACSEFGCGSDIGSNAYVVYIGNQNNTTVSLLESGRTYFISLFSYNSSGNNCYMSNGLWEFATTDYSGVDINFTVKDATTGNPISNASLTFNEEIITTNSTGNISFTNIPGGTTKLGYSIKHASHLDNWGFIMPNSNQTININLEQINFEAPNTLTINKDYKDIDLNWSPVIYENFDGYDEFSLTNSNWIYYDIDKTYTWPISNHPFPNENYTGSFIIFNPHHESVKDLSIPWSSYSGKQVAICFNAVNTPTNDWMLSPQITIKDGDALKVMAKSISAAYGLERLRVLISTNGGSEITDFIEISESPYIEVPTGWTPYTFDLSAYKDKTIRFALNCVSNNAYALLLDEIQIINSTSILAPKYADHNTTEPKNTSNITQRATPIINSQLKSKAATISSTSGVVSYNIYRDNSLINTVTGASSHTFSDIVSECQEYSYTIKPFYNINNTEASNNISESSYSCYSIIFHISNNNEPIANAQITIDGVTKYTNSNGDIVFDGFENNTLPIDYLIICNEYPNYQSSITLNSDMQLNLDLGIVTDVHFNPLNEITIRPNPSIDGKFSLNSQFPIVLNKIQIYNQLGQLIIYESSKSINNNLLIDLSKSTERIFYLKIEFNNLTKTYKLIKY